MRNERREKKDSEQATLIFELKPHIPYEAAVDALREFKSLMHKAKELGLVKQD